MELQHRLREAGHAASIASKSQLYFGTDTTKLERYVRSTPANAWIVMSGSHRVLEWFAHSEISSFAIFGRMQDLPIAGARLAAYFIGCCLSRSAG